MEIGTESAEQCLHAIFCFAVQAGHPVSNEAHTVIITLYSGASVDTASILSMVGILYFSDIWWV